MFPNHLAGKYLVLSLASTSLSAILVYFMNSLATNEVALAILAIIAILAVLIAAMTLHLALLPVSRLHSLTSATLHYILNVFLYYFGWFAWRKVEFYSKNVQESQEKLLMSIVTQNRKTELGQRLGLEAVGNFTDFKARVPLSTYEDYRPYIERIEQGENNLMSSDPVVRLNVSSGTTGKVKLLPSTKPVFLNFLKGFVFPLIFRRKANDKSISPFAPVKSFDLLFAPQWRYSSSGLPIGPLSGMPGKELLISTLGRTTPTGLQNYMNEPAQIYIHFLFALLDDEITTLTGSFAGSQIIGFEFLQNNWKQLTSDIRKGALTNSFAIPLEIAEKIKIWPDPARADFLENQFSQGFEGIALRIWPKLRSNVCICTGAHTVYIIRLQWFLGKNVGLISPLFGSSEAPFGFPMDPKHDRDKTYALLAGTTFMEFIPEAEIGSKSPSTVLMHQLDVGQRYEIVLSTAIGFYRYRIGDIINVVGHYHQTPVVEFCTRVGGILDLHGEKTSEDTIYRALQKSVAQWNENFVLHDFTASEGESLGKALKEYQKSYLYYVLFVEVKELNRRLTDDEITIFDDSLKSISFPYKSFRDRQGINIPEIFVVKPGTFELLKRTILDRNAAVSNQYKTPRYQSNSEFLRFLVENSFCEK